MRIIVNGEPMDVQEDCTAAQLVRTLDLADQRIAMEVNLEIVPRGIYDAHVLRDGDKVEVVRAIGGG